tara:strand:- start:248 stop:481 length:234 start_codon:yes stop_codon:yes gene_type:complete
MDKLLSDIVKSIVDKPEDVCVFVNDSEDTRTFKVSVGEGDLGKVIGKKGKNVIALRTLLSAATIKECGKTALIELVE